MKPLRLDLPTWPVSDRIPELPAAVFARRLAALERAREDAGLDALLVYADREHAANLRWLTGFDPRFEEALWVQGPRPPSLLVGNECAPFARAQLRVEASVRLYQDFSLPGQDRSANTDLHATLAAAGLGRGMRCGLIGWKPMAGLDVPHWVVAAVEDVTGGTPVNAAHLLMDPAAGLRVRVEPEAVPCFEHAGALASEGMRSWVRGLREGLSEAASAGAFRTQGLELSCHPMVNFGAAIPSGLKSPRNNVVARGAYAQAALGIVGGLSCRAGRLVGARDPDADGYLHLVGSYLEVVRSWYAQIRVGAAAGVAEAAAAAAKDDTWDFALNPGHLLHYDEWVGSPFTPGSAVSLASGMVVQQDIIPVPREGPAVLNMEDGFLLADENLRARLAREQPALLRRCRERRDLMRRLGYEVHDDVLPLSNIPGVTFPFLLEPDVVASLA